MFQIGPHTFIFLLGNVPVVRQEVEVITTPGEDFHYRRLSGLQSPTFDLKSVSAYTSKIDARNAFDAFRQMLSGGFYDLVKDGLEYTTEAGLSQRYGVNVLDVKQEELQFKTCMAGAASAAHQWRLDCSWSLILVPRP